MGGKTCQQRGEVAEWFKATVLKTVVPQGTVSSNLTLSALGVSTPSEFAEER